MLRLLFLLGMKSARNEKYSHGALGTAAAACLLVVLMGKPSVSSEAGGSLTRSSIALTCLQKAHLVLGKLHISVPVSASHLLKAILVLVFPLVSGILSQCFSRTSIAAARGPCLGQSV